jgi:two-component system, chemotaxis family, response regulator PixG
MHLELNPVKLLTDLSSSRSSGLLEVSHAGTVWTLVLEAGDLKYALCSVQPLDQLDFHLRRLSNDTGAAVKALAQSNLTVSEDVLEPFANSGFFLKAIAWLKAEGLLTATQTSQLIQEITQDTLELFLWLTQGTKVWLAGDLKSSLSNVGSDTAISDELLGSDLPALIARAQQRLQGWRSCSPAIQSPYQRPYVLNHHLMQRTIPSGSLSATSLEKLAQLMRGISLRQLALLLKQDELKVSQLLCPYVKHGVVCLRDPQTPFDRLPTIPPLPQSVQDIERGFSTPEKAAPSAKSYQIVCIDDSPTILDEIERFLGHNTQYSLTKVDDPMKAVSIIFRMRPDLILMDITMPGINGYKLCSLFRSSEILANTPIIMVTGNTGLIDKARAKMVGATDYLSKPFNQLKLINIVEKYLA